MNRRNESSKGIIGFVIIILIMLIISSCFSGYSAEKDYNTTKTIKQIDQAYERFSEDNNNANIFAQKDENYQNVIYGDDWREVVNPDGTRTRSIGFPTYFEDDEYYPVDVNIKELDMVDYRYGVETGKYQVYFKEDITGSMPVMVNFNDYELSMQLNELGYYDHQTNQYKNLPVRSSYGWPMQNTIRYQNIMPDMDLEYNYGIIGIKENIILNDISNYDFNKFRNDKDIEFNFEILYNEDLKFWANDEIVISNSEVYSDINIKNREGSTIFIIPRPVIYEQNNPIITTYGYFELNLKDHRTFLTLKVPVNWLLEPERQFPIVIDPAINIDSQYYTVQAIGLWSGGNSKTNVYMGAENTNAKMYGLYQLDFSSLSPYVTIIDGRFYTYIHQQLDYGKSIIPYRIIEPWNQSTMANIADLPSIAESHSTAINLQFYQYYDWNITTLAQGWVSKLFPNYGMAFTTISPTGSIWQYSSGSTNSHTSPPYINITYINNSVQILPKITDVIRPEDAPPMNIKLSNNEYRRFEKFYSRNNSWNTLPFYGASYDSMRIQFIYFGYEIGMSGIIDKISFLKRHALNGFFENFSVRMAHTTLTGLTTTFDSNYYGNLIEVYNVSRFYSNESIYQFTTLDIQNIFNYQTDYNLVVDIRWNYDSGQNIGSQMTSTPNGRAFANNYYATTAITSDASRVDLKFEILSTDEAVAGFNGIGSKYPFLSGSTYLRHQSLYQQSSIGKSGIIDKIYFFTIDTNSGTYTNLSIKLTNSNLTELATTFDNNYGTGTPLEVFNQTTTVTGKLNDWIVFDVADNFYYNNEDNLLVELKYDDSNANNFVGTGAIKISNHVIRSTTKGSPTGSTDLALLHMKIKFKDLNLTWEVSDVNNDLIEIVPTGPPGDDLFRITPTPNANGEDSVRFTLRDTLSGWSTYQDVNIIIEPVNDPPMKPYNLTPGQWTTKQWFNGPIPIFWEHMDIDSLQDNISLEYKLGPSGSWQKVFNSSDTGQPYPEPMYLWQAPPNADAIFLRVSTFDGEFWSPWNISQNPIGFDNISKLIHTVEIKDIDKNNVLFVKNGHEILITAYLTQKFFADLDVDESIFFANLNAFGGGVDIPADISRFPEYITWNLQDISTVPLNGIVPMNIWIDPLVFGFEFNIEVNTTADNLPVEIREPSIKPDQWINHSKNIDFRINISDVGSGVDFTTMQFQVWPDGAAGWGPWKNITLSRNRGNFVIPKILLNLNEGANNKVRTRAMDVIGNDYTESPPYIIKVDSSGVEYNEVGEGTSAWYKNTKVLARINITDNVSGVKLSTIRFRNSTNGKDGYKNWTAVPIENIKVMGKSVLCSVEVDFVEGIGNYLQWSAEDIAGNYLESDHLNYNVDMTPPVFSNANPENNGFVNNYTYKCSIDINDAISGVNTSSINYRTSKNGTDKYTAWKSATVTGGTRAIKAEAQGDFADGENNYIQWQVEDFAGNLRTSIDYKITIDLTGVKFSNPKPIQTSDPSTWSPTKEVNCSITITDTNEVSNVDATSIQYRYSTSGVADTNFGSWQSAGLKSEENAKSITVTVKILLDYGEDNYIQWRASDVAGNTLDSTKFQVRVKEVDSDNDGMPDDWEKRYNLDPNDPNDADDDDDNDGLTNLEEYNLIKTYGQSTDPTNPDTDGDNVNDGDEVKAGTNPFNNADFPEKKKGDDDKEGAGFNFLWIIIIIIIIIVILLIIFLVFRRKKSEKETEPKKTETKKDFEEEERDFEEPEEVEVESEEEEEELAGGWELADEEEEDVEEESEPGEELEEPASKVEPELDDDFIDFDIEETPSKPAKGKAPTPPPSKAKAQPPKKGKLPKKGKEIEPEDDFSELEEEELEDIELEDIEVNKKEPAVVRRTKKPMKGKLQVKKRSATGPAATPPSGPLMMKLDESTTCNICLGVIKTGLTIIKCKCGKKYHDSCAGRVGICPSCDTDLSNPTPFGLEEPEEMTDDDLEAFDIDE